MSQQERVAIVTAASQGIGAACARELARQGYRIVLMARSEEVLRLAEELGGVAIRGSVMESSDLDRLVELTMKTHGRIDAVVNNTGHPARGELLELSDQAWHEGLDLLLLSVVRLTRRVTPIMEQQGGGAWVNISTAGAVEPSLSFPISSAIRASLAAFTKLYADRYGASAIRMNNVLPGFADSYEVDAATLATIPMGRSGSVAEMAQAVAFLVSDQASYITGQSLRLDGGMTRSL